MLPGHEKRPGERPKRLTVFASNVILADGFDAPHLDNRIDYLVLCYLWAIALRLWLGALDGARTHNI